MTRKTFLSKLRQAEESSILPGSFRVQIKAEKRLFKVDFLRAFSLLFEFVMAWTEEHKK